MNIITMDFETYYDLDYSLSKLTTEEYVRDPRFEVIGLSVIIKDAPALWFPKPQVRNVLERLQSREFALLCHNTQFDGFILSDHYGLVPRLYLDTQSMARPHNPDGVSLARLAKHYEVGEKGTEVVAALGKHYVDFTPYELARYGNYCMNDSTLTRALYDKLLPDTPKRELLLIDRTIRMFCVPRIILDTALLRTYHAEVVAKKGALLLEVALLAPQHVLMSNPQLAALLESMGVDVPMKRSEAKSKTAGAEVMTYAFGKTDAAFTALLDDPDPLVAAIVEARLGVKSSIEETRSKRFLDMSTRGPMPVALQYSVANTMRWGGGDKQNLQNLKRGGTLRKTLMAPSGYKLCAVDSSNIELRVNHTIAGQADSVQAFKDKRDLYCEFATILFERPITKADVDERFLGKLAHLSLGYGCGAAKFQHICRLQKVPLSLKEAKRIVDLWRATYPKVPKFWRNCDIALKSVASGVRVQVDTAGLVHTAFEKLVTRPCNQIRYPGLQRDVEGGWFYIVRNQKQYLYGAKVVENVCQHLARNIVAEQLLIISNKYPVVLTVHDENVYLAPDDEADEALAFGVKVMSTSPDWWPEIPLAAEGEVGERYS